MATMQDRHTPTFLLFPTNNNRTAWRPIGQPVILVVPHRRGFDGGPLSDSGVFNVRIYIEDVPQEARVAGPDHIGQRFPDRELYATTVDSLELSERRISPSDYTITRGGEEVEFA